MLSAISLRGQNIFKAHLHLQSCNLSEWLKWIQTPTGTPFNLRQYCHIHQFVKEILNLGGESSYLFCSLCYSHFDLSTLKMGLQKVSLIVTFYIPPGFKFSGDSEYEVRISKFSLCQSLYPYLRWFAIAKLESAIANVLTDITRKAIITVLSHVYTTWEKNV